VNDFTPRAPSSPGALVRRPAPRQPATPAGFLLALFMRFKHMKALYTRKGLHLAVAVLAAVLVSSACFAAPDGLTAVTMLTPEQILATSLGMFAAAGITKRFRSLADKKSKLVKEARAIVDAAEAEGREL